MATLKPVWCIFILRKRILRTAHKNLKQRCQNSFLKVHNPTVFSHILGRPEVLLASLPGRTENPAGLWSTRVLASRSEEILDGLIFLLMSLLLRIMGLYASVVLVIGKFVREFFSGISHTIMFEELPNVDRILKLCTDIFLVRETGELDLEEDMYAKLIFLYRSPETMIKWTREKTQ